MKSTGTVVEIQGEKAKVAMGTIQMSLSLHDIEPLMASNSLSCPNHAPYQRKGGHAIRAGRSTLATRLARHPLR